MMGFHAAQASWYGMVCPSLFKDFCSHNIVCCECCLGGNFWKWKFLSLHFISDSKRIIIVTYVAYFKISVHVIYMAYVSVYHSGCIMKLLCNRLVLWCLGLLAYYTFSKAIHWLHFNPRYPDHNHTTIVCLVDGTPRWTWQICKHLNGAV